MAAPRNEKTLRLLEEIESNAARITTLLKEGKEEAADALEKETAGLVKQLPVHRQSPARKRVADARAAATGVLDGESLGSELEVTSDYRVALPDADKKVADAAKQAVALMGHTVSAYQRGRKIAEMMTNHFLTLRRDHMPDIMALSQAARDLSAAVWEGALHGYLESHPDTTQEEGEAILSGVKTNYTTARSDLMAEYIREISEEDFQRLYGPVAEKHPDHSPQDALSLYFRIDRLGRSERKRQIRVQRKLMDKRADLEVGSDEYVELTAQITEIDELLRHLWEVPKEAAEVSPKQVARELHRMVKQVKRVTDGFDPQAISALPESEKQRLLTEFSAISAPFQRAIMLALPGAGDDSDEE